MPPEGGTSRGMKKVTLFLIFGVIPGKGGGNTRSEHTQVYGNGIDTCRNKVILALPLRSNLLCVKANVSESERSGGSAANLV